MCSGQTIHHIEGNPPLTLRTGELLFLNQNAVHSVEQPQGRRGRQFHRAPQFFDYALALIGTDNILGKFLLGSLRQNGVGQESPAFSGFGCASRAESGGKPGVEPRASATQWPEDRPDDDGLLMMQLLNCTQNLPETSGNSLVLAALREIEENYRAADLSRLARELHVSLPALSAGVHQATGHTFKALLLEKRLSKAAQLLRETKLSTQDIIFAVGYENTSYFYALSARALALHPKNTARSAAASFFRSLASKNEIKNKDVFFKKYVLIFVTFLIYTEDGFKPQMANARSRTPPPFMLYATDQEGMNYHERGVTRAQEALRSLGRRCGSRADRPEEHAHQRSLLAGVTTSLAWRAAAARSPAASRPRAITPAAPATLRN